MEVKEGESGGGERLEEIERESEGWKEIEEKQQKREHKPILFNKN